MIKIFENTIKLDTNNTSLILNVTRKNDIEISYYGARVDNYILEKSPNRELLLINGLYAKGDISYNYEELKTLFTCANRGDTGIESIRLANGNTDNFDFVYATAEIDETPIFYSSAHSHSYDNSLKLVFKERSRDIVLELWFLVYSDCDVITRFQCLRNNDNDLVINAMMSAQYDFDYTDSILNTFDGAWGKERRLTKREINYGQTISSSRSGLSSPECNPFFIVADKNCTEFNGNCYAFNLIYSGNHELRVERNYMNRLRVQHGILRDGFSHLLSSGETFITPESVATYSAEGNNRVSQNMSKFIHNHILRHKESIPIMLNTWEAMYFDISKEKIISMAEKASELGFEGLVIDDGWFGIRNDDTTSLGDWYPNKAKFPEGMEKISDIIHSYNLKFGLWFEPEMISENSELFRAHPDWAVKDNSVRPIVGRGQYILDFSKREVQEYMIKILTDAVGNYHIDYMKWDCNRKFAEINRTANGENFNYAYIKGLYNVLDAIMTAYPSLIIEGCASGGGRFDLGILCYSPIIWASDNADPYSRMFIQEGTSYGYPTSVTLCHLCASPNHVTKRVSSLYTRMNVASFGAYGAQFNPLHLDEDEQQRVKEFNELIKANRAYDSKFYRLAEGFVANDFVWQTMCGTDTGRIMIFRKRVSPILDSYRVKLKQLDAMSKYELINTCNGEVIAVASGEVLMKIGLQIPTFYQGNERKDNTIELYDNTAIVFKINKLIRSDNEQL